MRRLLICTALVAAPSGALAQERSLWELFSPDRIVTQLVQYGLIAARTQMELTYGDLSVSLAEGRLSLEGVEMVIPAEVMEGPSCPVRIAGIEVLTGDPFAIERLTGQVSMRGIEIASRCLPPAAMPMLAALPEGRLAIPEVTIDYDYDVPSAGLRMATRARVDGLAAVTMDTDFDYLWFRGEEPDFEIAGRLNGAAVTVENLGAWESFSPFLPPAATDPDQAAAFVTQTVGGLLEARAEGPMPKSAKAFVTELAEGWTAFVVEPKRLVIESGFSASNPREIDGETVRAIERSPLALIDLLEPRVGNSAAAERAVLSADLVRRAVSAPGSLSGEEQREVGLALLAGDRAPRNPALARDLLEPLAEAGDGEVALRLARALADRDADAAYAQALAAGPTGAPGLRGLLDELEAEMPFATRLRLQSVAPEPGPDDLSAPTSELRARAGAHLRGVGAPRSLRAALIYASVAAARGDGAARDLLARIDRAIPPQDAGTWAPVEQEAAGIAMDAWLNGGR